MIFSFWAVQHWDAARPYLYFARMDETYTCPSCSNKNDLDERKRCNVCNGNGCVSAQKYVNFNWQKDHDAKKKVLQMVGDGKYEKNKADQNLKPYGPHYPGQITPAD